MWITNGSRDQKKIYIDQFSMEANSPKTDAVPYIRFQSLKCEGRNKICWQHNKTMTKMNGEIQKKCTKVERCKIEKKNINRSKKNIGQ